ncbi:MAG: T9SS type A sorting domain-containing protein [Bacteroidia bacterium]
MMTNKWISLSILIVLSLSANALPAQLAGGDGDGYGSGNFIGLLSGDSLTTYVSGGNGDGFSHSRRGGFLDGPDLSTLLRGGNGDGYGADDFLGVLSGFSTRTMYSSGSGDGFAHARASGSLQGVVFPIALLSFEAIPENDNVLLQWITESELNNDFFTIERSQDANTFRELLQVPGSGTTQSRHSYESIDQKPLGGYSYYRLKATDFDGSFSYSQIVAVNMSKPSSWRLLVYPNPNAGKTLHLHFSGIKGTESIELEIVDALGARIFSQSLKPDADTFELSLDLPHRLAKGSYLVRMRSAQQQLSKVVIVQ